MNVIFLYITPSVGRVFYKQFSQFSLFSKFSKFSKFSQFSQFSQFIVLTVHSSHSSNFSFAHIAHNFLARVVGVVQVCPGPFFPADDTDVVLLSTQIIRFMVVPVDVCERLCTVSNIPCPVTVVQTSRNGGITRGEDKVTVWR